MKPLYTLVLAILTTMTIIGMVTTTTISTQQASAQTTAWNPPPDAEKRFKELTKDFEKAVLDAIATKDFSKIEDVFPAYCNEWSSLNVRVTCTPSVEN